MFLAWFSLAMVIQATSMDSISIMTFNVLNFNDGPDWQRRVIGVADIVKNLQPDIVAFQELRSGCGDDQYEDLRKLLSTSHPFSHRANFMEYTQYKCSPTIEGQAIFSRFPVEQWSSHRLVATVKNEDNNQRGFLHARVRLPVSAPRAQEVTLDLFATHFSLGITEQMHNAKALLQHMSQTIENEPRATQHHCEHHPSHLLVLVGDLNSFHQNSLLSYLQGSSTFLNTSGFLTSAWHAMESVSMVNVADSIREEPDSTTKDKSKTQFTCTYHCDGKPEEEQQRDHLLFFSTPQSRWQLQLIKTVPAVSISDHRPVFATLSHRCLQSTSQPPPSRFWTVAFLLSFLIAVYVVRRFRRS
eukprot:m.66594 g.66594  ORF g.66594 m.66594 type:complete len:357 (-) comp12652_c0_seq3:2830-3900(-)